MCIFFSASRAVKLTNYRNCSYVAAAIVAGSRGMSPVPWYYHPSTTPPPPPPPPQAPAHYGHGAHPQHQYHGVLPFYPAATNYGYAR